MNEQLMNLNYCPDCREAMIAENGVPKCFNCAGKKSKKNKNPVAVEIPNAQEFQKVVGEPIIMNPNTPTMGRAGLIASGHTAIDALTIMKNLPMPKDMKEFKQIQKIIKQLEKLVGDDNGK
jgi:hypothetical protein